MWGEMILNRKIVSYRQSIGLSGVNCYLSQYRFFFRATGKKVTEKKGKIAKKYISENQFFFSITEQLFAKLLSHSSNTVCHH